MRRGDDRGDAAVDAVILIPSVLVIGLLLAMGGRLVQARGAVSSAAHEAARAASISRTEFTARDAADATVTTTLASSDVRCESTEVVADLSAFSRPLGQRGTVSVRVSCVVPLSDLGIPGTPGSVTVTSTGRSSIDAYRERT